MLKCQTLVFLQMLYSPLLMVKKEMLFVKNLCVRSGSPSRELGEPGGWRGPVRSATHPISPVSGSRMKSPRLLRSPFLWILAAFLLIMLGMNLFSASSRYQQVPTSKVISVIEGNDALREVVMVDGDQEIRLEYKDDGGARLRANWVGQQSLQIVDRLNAATRKVLEDPGVKKRIEDTGSFVIANTPEQFAQQIKDELAVYKQVVTKQKLTLQ